MKARPLQKPPWIARSKVLWKALVRRILPPAAETSGVASALNPLLVVPYMAADGPYSVSEVPDFVLHDAKRNKVLHVRVFIQTNRGRTP